MLPGPSDTVSFNAGSSQITLNTAANVLNVSLYSPTVWSIANGANLTISNASSTLGYYNGIYDFGQIVQTGGVSQPAWLGIGYGTGNMGSYSLSGGFLTADTEAIGLGGGVGSLLQTGGLHTVGSFTVGWNGGTGTATITNGSLTLTTDAWIGDGFAQTGTGMFNQKGGTVVCNQRIYAARNGTLNLYSGNLSAFFLVLHPYGVYNQSGGTCTLTNMIFFSDTETNPPRATISGGVLNTGQILLPAGTYTNTAVFTQNGGRVVLGTAGAFIQTNGWIQLSGGTFSSAGNLYCWGGTFRQNGGTNNVAGIQLGRDTNAPGIYLVTGGTLNVSNGITINSLGMLSGNGTVNGTVANGGFVAPGAPFGILTVKGAYGQTTSGALNIQIGGRTAGTQYDRLAVTANASLNGTLNVSFTNGFTAQAGDRFTVLTGGALNGTFSMINITNLGIGMTLVPVYSNNSVTLIASAPPAITGHVYCACDTNPIPNASVQIGNLTTNTDNSGSYTVSGISPGTYPAVISQSNFVSITNLVTMPSVAVATNDFTLAPVPSLTRLRVSLLQASNVSLADPIDAPIVPTNSSTALSSAADLGLGVVADDVTPVVFRFTGRPANYSLSMFHDAFAYTNGILENHLFVLQGGAWAKSTNITTSSFAGTCTAYAYLEGLHWKDFIGVSASNQVAVALKIKQADNSLLVGVTNFLVRPPPIFLVHGYNANGTSWSAGFTNVLAQELPLDFIVAINYGTSPGTSDVNLLNRTLSFDDLLPYLDNSLSQSEANIRLKWAFTRYDVVGHSQGGVLLRMFCQQIPNRTEVVSGDNFYRGRFRRIITIGSPHNGSMLLRYLLDMLYSKDLFAQDVPNLLKDLIQPKFDPFGPQILEINNPHLPVDVRMKFHCIRTTIDNGLPPQPAIHTAAESFVGLWQARPNQQSAGQAFLPKGYDGIVDFDSQGGGPGTHVTTITNSPSKPVNIAHAAVTFGLPALPDIYQLFGVYADEGQTTDPVVASEVLRLVDADASEFGPFVLPNPLTDAQKTLVDSAVPKPNLLDTIVSLLSPQDLSSNYYYAFQVPTNLPSNGSVSWFAQVFGPGGISSDGISLKWDTNASTRVTVTITNDVQGSVVLYAVYSDPNGDLVFAKPVVVVSRPVGSTLTHIDLSPSAATLYPGEILPTSIWGGYNNQMRSELYIPAGQVNYVSSNPSVATVDSRGTIKMQSFGAATIFASYNVRLTGGWITRGMIVHENDGTSCRHNGRPEHFSGMGVARVQSAQGDQVVTNNASSRIKNQHHQRLLGHIEPFGLGNIGLPILSGPFRGVDEFGRHAFPDPHDFEFMRWFHMGQLHFLHSLKYSHPAQLIGLGDGIQSLRSNPST